MPDTNSEPGSYLVLARRLRPQRFEAVLGQEHVTRSLKSALTTGRLAHAYLFCGARGVGKTTVARILARALNCRSYPAAEPCGECPSCREMASGQAVDFLEIDGASNRGIAEIRELRENVRYLPAHGRYKVYLIDEVHMLTEPAFNALLKTLEEPPPHVVFIFATTAPQKVPATILSRCQRYDFRRLPEEMIAGELARVCAEEGRQLEPEAAALIAREAEGSMRDGLSLLEQVFAAWPAAERCPASGVAEALGLTDRKLVEGAFAAIVAGDAARLLAICEEIHAFGQDAQQFCQLLLQEVRDALAARLLADRPEALGRLVRATPDELAELRRLAAEMSQETLQLYFDILMEALARIRRSGTPRLTLEMTLLRLATLEPALPLDDVLTRLARLEERLAQRGGSVAAGEQQGLFAESAPETGAHPAAEAHPGAAAAGSQPAKETSPQAQEPGLGGGRPDGGVLLERVRSWAKENDGKLFAALGGGSSLEGEALLIAPGLLNGEDLRQRAAACIEALGLGLEVRIARNRPQVASEGGQKATLQDVYDIFGVKPTEQ